MFCYIFTLKINNSKLDLNNSKLDLVHVQKHEKVSCQLVERFGRWQDLWKQSNVTPEMESSFADWLQGRVDGLKPGLVTVTNLTDNKTRPPYHCYVKYSVVVSEDTDCVTNATD